MQKFAGEVSEWWHKTNWIGITDLPLLIVHVYDAVAGNQLGNA